MKQLLLYNLKGQKGKQIEKVCLPLHLGVLYVEPCNYLEQLGALTGTAGFAPKGAPACGAVFDDEMIVFSGLPTEEIYTVLDALREAGIQVSLKATLTPYNIHWDSLQLHKELLEEQKAMGR